jgi:hypothetical protein
VGPPSSATIRACRSTTRHGKGVALGCLILSLPERMAQPHPAMYFMRGPGPNMRITKRVDPVTHQLIAYTLEGVFGRNDDSSG